MATERYGDFGGLQQPSAGMPLTLSKSGVRGRFATEFGQQETGTTEAQQLWIDHQDPRLIPPPGPSVGQSSQVSDVRPCTGTLRTILCSFVISEPRPLCGDELCELSRAPSQSASMPATGRLHPNKACAAPGGIIWEADGNSSLLIPLLLADVMFSPVAPWLEHLELLRSFTMTRLACLVQGRGQTTYLHAPYVLAHHGLLPGLSGQAKVDVPFRANA